MFKPLLCASIAGLFLLTRYGVGAPTAPPFPNPDAPARLHYLMDAALDERLFQSLTSAPETLTPFTPSAPGQVVVTQSLSPVRQAEVVVRAGYDKGTGKGHLAWSPDRGRHWIDLSSLLPGSEQANTSHIAEVARLAQDKDGRLLLTMDGQPEAKGKVLHLTLGKKMDWWLL